MATSMAVNGDMTPVKYAWPGGYPVYYAARQGWRNQETGELEDWKASEVFEVCATCAGKPGDLILIAQEVNYEDPRLYCDVCGDRIESAYAEDHDGEGEDE